jgi:hypothetical protein
MASTINATTDEAVKMREDRFASENLKAQSKMISSLWNDTQSDREALNKILIAENSIVDLIVEIEKIGQKSGSKITVQSIESPVVSVENPNMKNVLIKVSATGSWTAVSRALILAENLPYPTIVNKIRMDKSGGAGDSKDVWTLSMDIRGIVVASK